MNLQYIQPGRWQRVPDYDAEWEVNFDIPQTVESVGLDAAEGVTVKCSPVSMEITVDRLIDLSQGWAVYLKDGTEVELRSRDGNQTARKTEMKMIFCRAIAPEEIEAVYGSHILQKETDSIENGDVKFFVWAEQEEWGFQVVPVYCKMDELYLGKAEFFSFESDNWVNSFFDGKK